MFTFNIYDEEWYDGERDCFIERLAAEVSEAYSDYDAFDVLWGLMAEYRDFKHLNAGDFLYKDYLINIRDPRVETTAMRLNEVRDLGLRCAPKLTSYLITKNQEGVVLVVQVPGADKGKIVSYDDAIFEVSKESRLALMKDIDILYEKKRMINKSILDCQTWGYTPVGDIIISDWSNTHKCNNEEYFLAYKKRILELTGLIYYGYRI